MLNGIRPVLFLGGVAFGLDSPPPSAWKLIAKKTCILQCTSF